VTSSWFLIPLLVDLLFISKSEVYRTCCEGGRTVCLPYANASAAAAHLLRGPTHDITTRIT